MDWLHRDAMHEAEHQMMEALTDGGSATMMNLKGQLQVAREEMVRLEKDESDMKQRFSDLRQRVLAQANKPMGQDIEAATKRIDMEERVAVERMKLKRTRHEQAMEALGKQLEQQEGSLDGDAKEKAQRFRRQQSENAEWEASFEAWEQTMGDKMSEAKAAVEVLKRKIADEAGKWELVTLPALEAQLTRLQSDTEARINARVRLERNMSRVLGGMQEALAQAGGCRGPLHPTRLLHSLSRVHLSAGVACCHSTLCSSALLGTVCQGVSRTALC
jgi:hypothetical protein